MSSRTIMNVGLFLWRRSLKPVWPAMFSACNKGDSLDCGDAAGIVRSLRGVCNVSWGKGIQKEYHIANYSSAFRSLFIMLTAQWRELFSGIIASACGLRL